jgi:hypothetical protein
VQTNLRLIGFTAASRSNLFPNQSVSTHSICRSLTSCEMSSFFQDVSPLQSSFTLDSRLGPFGPKLHLPRFRPSSRLHSGPSTFRDTSQSIATVRPQAFSTSRRFSPAQSFAGLFHPAATSRVHPVQGLLTSCSHPSSSEGACPHAVVTSQLTLRLPLLMPLDSEALFRTRPR